jgi:hypothetical protein
MACAAVSSVTVIAIPSVASHFRYASSNRDFLEIIAAEAS